MSVGSGGSEIGNSETMDGSGIKGGAEMAVPKKAVKRQTE